MMRRTALLVGVAVLAACSQGEPENGGVGNVAAPAQGAASNLTASVAGQGGTSRGAAGATGQVSALKGDVSGLNVRVTDMGTVIDLPADAVFEFDKAELTPAAAGELLKAAELIRAGPPGAIQVIGHTDSLGDEAYNQHLSEARARTVADWFGQQVGVRQRQFAVSGKGESAPIAPNQAADGKDDPAGRTKNRRVEVVIPGKGA